MGLAGIEPATSALSVLRSNRLSYSPSWDFSRSGCRSSPYLSYDQITPGSHRARRGQLVERPEGCGISRLSIRRRVIPSRERQ